MFKSRSLLLALLVVGLVSTNAALAQKGKRSATSGPANTSVDAEFANGNAAFERKEWAEAPYRGRLTFALMVLVTPSQSAQDKSEEFSQSAEEKAVLMLTNEARMKAGFPALVANPKLFKAARGHSATIARLDQIGHDLDGTTMVSRVTASGYQYRALGENCAAGQQTPKEAMESWLDSPGHRANLLNGDYTEIGLAVAISKSGVRYWTQVFGKPSSFR